MGTVTVGSDRQKPTSHASALRNWGFLPGAAEVGFFRSYPDRTPHDSRGRNWGRSELNRESDTPKGTGQLPACELVGWLKIEAQGCTEGPTAVHIRSTRKGVKPNPSFLSMGKGGFRVNLMNWGVSMTFRKVLCPHCRGKLETGQRIHPACIDGYADAQQAKKERADAKAARMAAKVERAETRRRKEAIKTIPDLIKEAQREFNAYIRARDADQPCICCGASRWEQEKWVARSTAGTTVPPEVHPVSDLMNGMLMPSARFATAGAQAALLITAWALWPALGWRLLKRWSRTTPPTSGSAKS